jgi:hypothetical protein
MSGSRWLCRGVSHGKGAEGKYFWEHLEDAIAWSKNSPTTVIVRLAKLDGYGNARFADLSQMNESLLAVEPAE